MLGERVQLRLELDNGLDGGPHINVIVVRLRGRLKAAQDGSAVRVRAVNDDDLCTCDRIEWKFDWGAGWWGWMDDNLQWAQ